MKCVRVWVHAKKGLLIRTGAIAILSTQSVTRLMLKILLERNGYIEFGDIRKRFDDRFDINVTNINIAERHFLGRGVSAINGIVG